MAFAIGDIREPDKMVLRKWGTLSRTFDLSEGEILRVVSDIIDRVSDATSVYEGPFYDHPTAKSINKLIRKQIKGMLHRGR